MIEQLLGKACLEADDDALMHRIGRALARTSALHLLAIGLCCIAATATAQEPFNFGHVCPPPPTDANGAAGTGTGTSTFIIEDSTEALKLTQVIWTGDRYHRRTFRSPADRGETAGDAMERDLELRDSTIAGEDARELSAARIRIAGLEGDSDPTIERLTLLAGPKPLVLISDELPNDPPEHEPPRKCVTFRE